LARYVFDTFAPYAFFMDEPGAGQVQTLLRAAEVGDHQIFMAMFNVGELTYKLWQAGGPERSSEALLLLDQWPVELVDADRSLILLAASFKAERRMGYLDCFPAALAIRLDASIVTGDSGFAKVEDVVAVHWLPRA
jgi:uncharacterized protein